MKLATSVRTFLAVSIFACMPLAVQAATVHLKATLAPASGVTSKGHGTLTATLDTTSNKLTYHVTYSGLSGPATAAHFHGPADPGANAGPQVPVTGSVASPISGKATITAEQAKDLLDGKWYFNVHTAANPGGEIRGQVTK
jgi:hypothetical protein